MWGGAGDDMSFVDLERAGIEAEEEKDRLGE